MYIAWVTASDGDKLETSEFLGFKTKQAPAPSEHHVVPQIVEKHEQDAPVQQPSDHAAPEQVVEIAAPVQEEQVIKLTMPVEVDHAPAIMRASRAQPLGSNVRAVCAATFARVPIGTRHGETDIYPSTR